eukprot:3550965-Amphidinium_carterae.1
MRRPGLQLNMFPKATTRAMGNNGTKAAKKGQQVPVQHLNDNDYYYGEEPISWDNPWDNSWSQEWCPDRDIGQQWSGQEVGQVLQQPPAESTASPPTMGSLYEIIEGFWSIIIDTGTAVSVCPMTSCEHIAVKTMPESARRQFVTATVEGLAISGWKEVTLVIGHMTMQIRFIVANIQSALLGLPDIDENN